jgi:hypothetical protein
MELPESFYRQLKVFVASVAGCQPAISRPIFEKSKPGVASVGDP